MDYICAFCDRVFDKKFARGTHQFQCNQNSNRVAPQKSRKELKYADCS